MNMQRYFIYLKYDGTNYHGWQRQPNGISVEEAVEKALTTVLRNKTDITGAGRTDAGVHAYMMVAHFDHEGIIDTSQLTYRLNRILPRDISIDEVVAVDNELHARFSATARTYHYYTHHHKNPFLRTYSWHIPFSPDYELMNKAAAYLLEVKDFGAFCKAGSDVKTTLCDVTEAHWQMLEEGRWCFVITANRFLRNMVRAIVGTLMDVGRHRITIEDFKRIIKDGKRTQAGESVPGHALFLQDIKYQDNI